MQRYATEPRKRVAQYLAQKKQCPPGTLQWGYAYDPMVVLKGSAVSYQRVTSEPLSSEVTMTVLSEVTMTIASTISRERGSYERGPCRGTRQSRGSEWLWWS